MDKKIIIKFELWDGAFQALKRKSVSVLKDFIASKDMYVMDKDTKASPAWLLLHNFVNHVSSHQEDDGGFESKEERRFKKALQGFLEKDKAYKEEVGFGRLSVGELMTELVASAIKGGMPQQGSVDTTFIGEVQTIAYGLKELKIN